MSVITDNKDQINDLMTFKHISAAFTEAAAVKLKNIRDAFNRNARYYEEINYIYHLVEMNAKRMQMERIKSQIERKSARLYIAFTSNQRFFGSINTEIMNTFIRDSEPSEIEKMIIGVTGKAYVRSTGQKFSYKEMDFKKDLPAEDEIAQFLKMTENYDQVRVFYPKFISFLKQEVGVTDITQKIALRDSKKNEKTKEIHLLFEPELDKMIKFFNTQVRWLLFQRIILESDMARTAARLLTMSQAEERTDFEIKKKKADLRKVIRSFTNAQLLDTFSGIKRWKH